LDPEPILLFRPIDPHIAKLWRPLGKAAPAFVALFRRGSGIAHLVDDLRRELFRADRAS
jgi:hypothetical protein